jgi:hypothetical protein
MTACPSGAWLTYTSRTQAKRILRGMRDRRDREVITCGRHAHIVTKQDQTNRTWES